MAREVVLKVNGDLVRMNAFVQEALAGVLEGFVGALDEVPQEIVSVEVSIVQR